jgi:hypothetical protein
MIFERRSPRSVQQNQRSAAGYDNFRVLIFCIQLVRERKDTS